MPWMRVLSLYRIISYRILLLIIKDPKYSRARSIINHEY